MRSFISEMGVRLEALSSWSIPQIFVAIYALLGCSDRARIPLYIVASLSRGVEHEARAVFEIVSFALCLTLATLLGDPDLQLSGNEVEYDEMNSSTRHSKPTLSRTTGDSTSSSVSTSAGRVSFCESDVSESDVP